MPNKIITVKYPIIFSFAYGYNWKNIKIFITSLRKNEYKGDILLAISLNINKEMYSKIIMNNVKYIIIEEKWPYYSNKNRVFPINYTFLENCIIEKRNYSYKWYTYRHSILLCWLLIYGKNYTHIFNLDSRDVVFQGNPVNWNFEDGVYLIDETKDKYLIKDNKINLNWIKKYNTYSNVINNKIINGGTIFGSANYYIPFLKQFCKFIKDNFVITIDQGSLNYAYYSGYFKKIKFHMNKNQYGVVITTGIDKLEVSKLIMNNTIYNADFSIPLIVHQYDRLKQLISLFKVKY